MATEHFFLVCTVSLCNVNGTIIPPGNASRVILNGDTVYNLHCLQDIDKTNSYFFVFNNLGVSTPGRYRLLVKIFDIRTGFGPRGQALSSLYSDVFEILSPGRFKGLSVSTELMKNFRRQGILISLRPDKNSQ
ncbi:velvet factor-domain-containing protein [Gorgonomyces haynaldii]|nr:velvet factor-domain-containing protein [Gorgonomyces haynaldii]